MPEISRFFGITIAMFYKDHAPPHFHAYYASHEITVNIKNAKINGKFSNRAKKLVLEWLKLHKKELLDNWQRTKDCKPLLRIKPLE